jgi:hypothetical protein
LNSCLVDMCVKLAAWPGVVHTAVMSKIASISGCGCCHSGIKIIILY